MKLSESIQELVRTGRWREITDGPMVCGELDPDNDTMFCVLEAGHETKHRDEESEEWPGTEQESDDSAELARLRKIEQQVEDLASEWERFGLQGAAQRLRHILSEVTR